MRGSPIHQKTQTTQATTQRALLRRTPRLRAGADLSSLSLDAREGYVLSRIDGETAASVLADLVGLDAADLTAILVRLADLGVVEWVGGDVEAEFTAEDIGDRGAGGTGLLGDTEGEIPPRDAEAAAARARVDAELEAALAEDGDLSRAQRLRIIAIGRDLEERTLWDVLGLRGDPSAGDIKKAYFSLSKQFHPDRYFGKNLGSFAKRIDAVFRGIKGAYDILGNKERCAAYRKGHPPPAAKKKKMPPLKQRGRGGDSAGNEKTGSGATPIDPEKRRRLEARRAEILAQRKGSKAKNPILDKARKAKELHHLGLEQLKDKDVIAAAGSLKLAAAYAPKNLEYQSRYEEVQQMALQLRTKELIDQAEMKAATGQLGAAAKLYAEASDLIPTMCNYALRAAGCYSQAGDRALGITYAERAVKASPRRKEARVLAAKLLSEKGDSAGAIAHLEVAASLDKNDAHVKKALKQLSKKLQPS